MIGLFIVDTIDEKTATAHAESNADIHGRFYLPPLSRPATSGITSGSRFFGVMDDVTGFGALIVAFGDADFQGLFKYDIRVQGGDVMADSVSLKSHTHPATLSVEGVTEDTIPVTGTATGTTGSAE